MLMPHQSILGALWGSSLCASHRQSSRSRSLSLHSLCLSLSHHTHVGCRNTSRSYGLSSNRPFSQIKPARPKQAVRCECEYSDGPE